MAIIPTDATTPPINPDAVIDGPRLTIDSLIETLRQPNSHGIDIFVEDEPTHIAMIDRCLGMGEGKQARYFLNLNSQDNTNLTNLQSVIFPDELECRKRGIGHEHLVHQMAQVLAEQEGRVRVFLDVDLRGSGLILAETLQEDFEHARYPVIRLDDFEFDTDQLKVGMNMDGIIIGLIIAHFAPNVELTFSTENRDETFVRNPIQEFCTNSKQEVPPRLTDKSVPTLIDFFKE